MEYLLDTIDSPIGAVTVVATDGALCAVEFSDTDDRLTREMAARDAAFTFRRAANPFGFSERLTAYFNGEIAALEGLPVDAYGTPFQKRVWAALRTIPVGTVTSYGAIAEQLGNPGASRAVGLANSRNPVAIVVPCHRVIGANATLTGYAGGLDRKQWLLEHEGVKLAADAPRRRTAGTAPRGVESLPLFASEGEG